MHELKATYQILAKWLFLVSFPVFIVMISYPRSLLSILFGGAYADAAVALQILALGFLIHTTFGTNSLTLLVVGKTRALFAAALTAAVLNLACSLTLVPRFGLAGAAAAAVLSYVALNVASSIALYHFSSIHVFSRGYSRVLAISAVLVAGHCLVVNLRLPLLSGSPTLPIFLGVVWLVCLLLAKVIDEDDFAFVSAIVASMRGAANRVDRTMRRPS